MLSAIDRLRATLAIGRGRLSDVSRQCPPSIELFHYFPGDDRRLVRAAGYAASGLRAIRSRISGDARHIATAS